MMYRLYVKQVGDGCDYMIGCGARAFTIEAEDADYALCMAKEILEVRGFLSGNAERKIEECFLVQVPDLLYVPWRTWEINESNERLAQKATLERAEYERLKKKFEG